MKRTPAQQAAIEVYCREVARSLNDAGFDLELVLKAKPMAVSCTQENIKETLFKPVMHALYPEITSTTKLEKMHVTDVYEHMNRWLANTFPEAEHVPFPSDSE